MSQSYAENLVRDLQRLPIQRTPVKRIFKPALQIGLRNKLAIYDSVYIAMALKSGLPLLTADIAQTQSAVKEGVIIVPITSF